MTELHSFIVPGLPPSRPGSHLDQFPEVAWCWSLSLLILALLLPPPPFSFPFFFFLFNVLSLDPFTPYPFLPPSSAP
ncbi:hypothetical protein GDO81_013618 [Engystomops pustulosus]|uniref:Uncharacterized protein n=1 Tax=Engystomops pustulosus TaxID=76066 RepID=A0AAV7B202_ENGPU|nr:hypothetical protein GDO81_013618 [Engystomops pustulosus]